MYRQQLSFKKKICNCNNFNAFLAFIYSFFSPFFNVKHSSINVRMGKDDMQIKNKRIKSLKKYFSLLISITFYLFSSLSLHNYKPESCLHSESYPPYHVLSILVVQYKSSAPNINQTMLYYRRCPMSVSRLE